MTKFKSLVALLMAAVMVLAFCSCGGDSEESTGVANPIHECSAQEMVEATGVPLDAPNGAEDVSYSYIDGTDEAAPVAQVTFTYDSEDYTYRAQQTQITELMEGTDLAKAQEIVTNLSGMYIQWKAAANTLVKDREAIIGVNKGDEGVIAWLDVVPGIMYSLSMDDDASQQILQDMADKCFVEAQGDN